jgi:hypothetical protein
MYRHSLYSLRLRQPTSRSRSTTTRSMWRKLRRNSTRRSAVGLQQPRSGPKGLTREGRSACASPIIGSAGKSGTSRWNSTRLRSVQPLQLPHMRPRHTKSPLNRRLAEHPPPSFMHPCQQVSMLLLSHSPSDMATPLDTSTVPLQSPT